MGWSSVLKSLLTVFVFSTLAVISVESYNCTKVGCTNGNCVENTGFCLTSFSCFSQIQKLETASPGTNLLLEQKGCATFLNPCDMEFSATLGNQQKFKYKNQCCTGDFCNKDNISLTPLSSEVNGVECPACYNEQNQTCPTTTTLKCTGAENKCVEVTGRDPSSKVVVYGKGCATESACTLNINILTYLQIKTSCIPAVSKSPALKSFASLPIVLFLLKIVL
ncbi:protein RoBo-1-like [Apodemus sylvaticus]|uniref:protein RoBo-1-like n=1 Tax=Apodemus sylvaticus TaxID=10129 RepID=UPI0022418F42|nr:protein RoBo-1-like [Apodemus sylvaticus]XP_052051761.1 protein RoBo-1-like [Apodemus sylvaticus]